MAPAAAALSITEERTYSARLGDRTVTGLVVSSAWEGFTKYTNSEGHLIVHDADQRAVAASPALLPLVASNSAVVGMPNIGDTLASGIYAGLTIHEGKLAMLVLMPGEASDVNWDDANKWAASHSSALPTRQELITLYQNLKSEFAEKWYWSGEQPADNADYAWSQYFYYGFQTSDRKSCAGRARAVRRLPI